MFVIFYFYCQLIKICYNDFIMTILKQLNSIQLNLMQLIEKLIKYPSITPNDCGCIDFICQYLKELNFCIYDLNSNNVRNMFAVWHPQDNESLTTNNKNYKNQRRNKILAFVGHTDVVPTGDIDNWHNNPFVLTEINNKLYARGIADMKGAIASFLISVNQYINNMQQNNLESNISIAICLTSDEEGPSIDGSKIIVEYLQKNNIEFDYCIIGEPSSQNKLGDILKTGRRGSINATIDFHGIQGHVAYPSLAKNPIHHFNQCIYELLQYNWNSNSTQLSQYDINNECGTSFQLTNIKSGFNVSNVIPESLSADFNIRYTQEYSFETIKNIVHKIFDQYTKQHVLRYSISWKHSAMPFYSEATNLFGAISKAIKKITNNDVMIYNNGGTSDGRFFIKVSKELLEFGLCNNSIHQINENINTIDLLQLSQIYYETMVNLNNTIT